jgi:DNA-binding GntR family transcriptional regulator
MAETKTIRRGESVDQVVRSIREGIVAGRFAQGQRLIARDLTDSLGFSRSTLREAFGHLASEGLVELIPNRGATVRRLSRREIAELFQIRELLEGLSARLAAAHVAATRAKKPVQAVIGQIDPKTELRGFHAQNLLVHGTLLQLGGNQQLAQLMAKLNVPFVMSQVRQSMQAEQIARSQREHITILRAVAAGDPDAAEDAMRAHLRNTGEWVMTLPDSAFRTE